MELRTEPKEPIAKWVLDQVGGDAFQADYQVIGVFDGERILGAVVYDAFTRDDCNLHICLADRHCVTRRIIRAVFAYPFRKLSLSRVSAQVLANNSASLEFVQRLGFVYEGTKRLRPHHQLLFGLLNDECKWLAPIYHERAA